MATLVLTTVGRLVGGPIGGAIGAVVGQVIDRRLFAPKAREGPRLGDLSVQTSSYGTAIPKIFGTMRVAGTVIWSTDLIESRATTGAKGGPRAIEYSYTANFAVALSARPVLEVRRIWADGKLLRGAAGDWKTRTTFRLHDGDEDQEVDSLIAAAEGADQAPAFRGIAYAVFEELALADFGNRIPSLTFEVVADSGPVMIGAIAEALGGGVLAAAGETPALSGYAASGDSVRAAVENLAEIVSLSVVDQGAHLALRVPDDAPAAIARTEESGRREIVRHAAASLPREVAITYYDAARDYQTGLQRAGAGEGAEARGERIGLPAVLDAGAAKAIAERRLDLLWAARASATVTVGWRRAPLRPGAVVRIEGEGAIWRIEQATIGAMTVRLELVRTVAEAAVVAVPASPGRVLEQTDLPHGPTVLRAFELPGIEGSERPMVAVLAAGTQAGWRRASLSAKWDDGAGWIDIGATAAPAVLGSAATALAPGDAALFDEANPVEVELLHDNMELLSRDDDALVAGANLAMLGDELVQFGRAERIAPRFYRLSRLLRGRRGTEWASSAHVVGEGFALIEPAALRIIDLPTGTGAGAVLALLAVGSGDEEPAEAELVVAGNTLGPPAPVHVRANPASSGTEISWVRRSRLGWAWISGADTPLGEERELYRLTFNGVRRIEVEAPTYFYGETERAGDGAGAVTVEIEQVGTHGASRPAAVTIA